MAFFPKEIEEIDNLMFDVYSEIVSAAKKSEYLSADQLMQERLTERLLKLESLYSQKIRELVQKS